MANRYMEEKVLNFEKGLVVIPAKATLTAVTGVVSAFIGKGITSFARSGVGEYTIVLDDKYNAHFGVHATVLNAAGEDLVPQVISIDVTSTKTIVLNLLAAATPAEVVAASELFVTIFLRNSDV